MGLDKKKEEQLCRSSSELSPETILALKNVSKASGLELFRKIFPTGKEIQQACYSSLGIKFEPNTISKRILEEFAAGAPLGPLWMAISAAGQVAVESGLITDQTKPFYEIGLAVLAHKALRIGKHYPTASEAKEISKSLVAAEIDLVKIKAGNVTEIARAEKEVSRFLDVRELKPRNVQLPIEETKISPAQASSVCGWKVGDPINNRTMLGDVPKWSTVRYRYWKNESLKHAQRASKANLKYELTKRNATVNF